MSENVALDRFIESAKESFKSADATIMEYPNVRAQKLLLLDVAVPKKFRKTEDLTRIAEALAFLAQREMIDDAEAFMSTDGRISVNVKPKKIS